MVFPSRMLLYLILIAVCIALAGCTRSINESPVIERDDLRPNARVDINSAGVDELEKLPGIGEQLAQKIVEFRQTNGKFRRREHLLLVDGVSEKKFREIRELIKAE